MKREDAIEQLAQHLKERAEAAIANATARLGQHGEITVKEVNYTAEAMRILDEAVITLAFNRCMDDLSWSNPYGDSAAKVPGAPPPPPAPMAHR